MPIVLGIFFEALSLSLHFSTEEFPDSARHPSGHLYTLATVSLVEWKGGSRNPARAGSSVKAEGLAQKTGGGRSPQFIVLPRRRELTSQE